MKKQQTNNELELKHTSVLTYNLDAYERGFRFIVNQGGSRSSKTYSICQLLVYLAIQKKVTISIVRKSLPSLKNSVLKDLLEILKENKIYNENNHNKTENIYSFGNGSVIEFFSVDDEQKIRGRKRDILYCNEANELDFPEFNQLMLRTTGAVFLDYNPSDTEHWIYDKVLTDTKSILIKSTYKDNPFLSKDQVEYIENLVNVDYNYYKIYALGERPISQTRVYTHFKKFVDLPASNEVIYGLDFGFNHPTVLVKVTCSNNKYYVEELVYESKLTTADLIIKLNNLIPDHLRDKRIYCDYARPEAIEELKRAGYKAEPADKMVKAGIDYIKSKEVFIHLDAVNLWREVNLYSWQSKGDTILDEVIKLNDDGLDSLRYAMYTGKKTGSGKWDYEIVFA